MSEKMYRMTEKAKGLFEFYGPGFPFNSCHRLNVEKDEAEQVLVLLEKAYEAGRAAKAEQIRRTLGCYEPRR